MCRFKAFHERYYHPSNARFWFYGDDPPAERLRLLSAYLDEFEAQPVDSAVSAQPLFQVRRHSRTYTCQRFWSYFIDFPVFHCALHTRCQSPFIRWFKQAPSMM